jgi:predicted anti-sigma-YlaC factor YlaD
MTEIEHQNCRQLLDSLSDYIDGSLEADICAQIESHLAECDNCRIVVDSLNKTVRLYQSSSQEVMVPEEVRRRLYHCLNLDEYLEA